MLSFSSDAFDYDDTTTSRNTFRTTTPQSWNNYGNNNNRDQGRDESFSQGTSGSSSKGSNNSFGREAVKPPSSLVITNTNQGRDIYIPTRRETSTSAYGFAGDSFSNSGNDNNYNVVTQRPANLRTPSTTTNYDYMTRTTMSSYRPNRETTTKQSSYFQGDLPFFSNDETTVRKNIFK